MDDKTQQIHDLFFDAEGLKRAQTKFTKTANAIKKEAVNGRFNILYTQEEIETLSKAVAILRNTTDKIQHAKEVKAREETRLELLDKHHREMKNEFINQNIDFKQMDATEVLILALALYSHYLSYRHIETDVNDLFEYPNRLEYQVNSWINDIKDSLREKFTWREEPDEKIIIDFLRDYKLSLRQETINDHEVIIEKFNTFLAVNYSDNVALLNQKQR